ncbi:hypothetical protein PCASD_07673 [Puccinia coronata f. sp. avenae]|uniref:Uncharacterized protein n=1 Tax=Puccinia coronata f. sp. avenae TaxID=200324 RepID=A0A2N5UP58_9BASI|nr:hypothetical protein PCASD_14802 [Puccinia coronata f. sp. avenae]PLW39541.1 hypothetical protein PCASD_07673 [Puccinia coronata f. sp. avenae]
MECIAKVLRAGRMDGVGDEDPTKRTVQVVDCQLPHSWQHAGAPLNQAALAKRAGASDALLLNRPVKTVLNYTWHRCLLNPSSLLYKNMWPVSRPPEVDVRRLASAWPSNCAGALERVMPIRDKHRETPIANLSSSGAATEAANDGGGGPIPPSAATFGSFARQRSAPAIN